MPVDQTRIDGAALALCAMTCPETRKGGQCESGCVGATDPAIWNCSHLQQMRRWATIVLNAKPADMPRPLYG